MAIMETGITRGALDRPPIPPFSLKTTLSTENIQQEPITNAELLSSMIEQIHPDRSAYATVISLIENIRNPFSQSAINKGDPYVVVGFQDIIPGGTMFVSRTTKTEEEAILSVRRVQRQEFAWMLNGEIDLHTHLFYAGLEDLREAVTLSQEELKQVAEDLKSRALNALNSDPEFLQWAGPDWIKNGVPIKGIGSSTFRKRDVSYFGSESQGGPLFFLRVKNPHAESILLQIGNPESKSEAARLSCVLHIDPNGKLRKDNIGAAERAARFIKKLALPLVS